MWMDVGTWVTGTSAGGRTDVTRITIRMNNSGGELDSRVLHVAGDAQDEANALLVQDALEAMVSDCHGIHPGDSFTVEEG